MADAQNPQFRFVEADAPEHQPVAPKSFDGVDPHSAHHFLYLIGPGSDQIDQSLGADLQVQALDKLRLLGGDSPVAFAAVAAA